MLIRGILITLIRIYQVVLSPHFGNSCRFSPSCSDYALGAIRRHGVWRGMRLAIRRLWRCRPLGPCGYDPVPYPDADTTHRGRILDSVLPVRTAKRGEYAHVGGSSDNL